MTMQPPPGPCDTTGPAPSSCDILDTYAFDGSHFAWPAWRPGPFATVVARPVANSPLFTRSQACEHPDDLGVGGFILVWNPRSPPVAMS
jgi:hypothetical protein